MIVIQQNVTSFIACAAFLFITFCHSSAIADGLIDSGQLQRQGLTRPWFNQVQMDVGRDRVENVNFDGELLTIQTKRGVIQTIDGETGETLWASNVSSPGLFTSSIGVGPDHAVLSNGSHLLVFDRKTGKQVWSRKLSGGVIGSPGVSDDFVFVPKVDGNLEVYSLDKPRAWGDVRSVSDTQFPVWRFNSHGKTMVQPTIFDGFFGWSNDRATFYVARIKPMEILFRLETFEDVVVPPVKIGSFLYVVSADGYLYKVNTKTGDIRWRFSTGTPLIYRPVARDGFVYISTPQGGLYRILADKDVAQKAGLLDEDNEQNPNASPAKSSIEEGNEVWFNPDIARILSVTSERIFGLDKRENLQIVDTETGQSLGNLPTGGVSIPITNPLTDRIYLASTDGLIQCIESLNRNSANENKIQITAKSDVEKDDGEADQKDPGEGDNPFQEEGDNSPDEQNTSEDDSDDPFEF